MLSKESIQALEYSLASRNIDFAFFDNRDAVLKAIVKETKHFATIGIGNSQTLKLLKVSEALHESGKQVYDKTFANSKEDIRKMKMLAMTSECYISSCNAVSLDGKLVNVDHSGNRVAAITYGPERVLLVIGANKIVSNEADAIKRALSVSTPKNAVRAGFESPCSRGEGCGQCVQEVRVCNYISVIRGQTLPGRMKVMLLDEEIGY